MKGVLLAGGSGSRLLPLTKVTNKHLLPVGRYPMIYHPLCRFKQAGITQVLIVTGREHMGAVVNLLGSGSEMRMELTFRVQDEAGGIAQAVSLAENFVSDERFLTLLGDNLFEDNLAGEVATFSAQREKARILLKEVAEPRRFGVAVFAADGTLTGVEEKPPEPKSNYAVTGAYFYSPDVFAVIRGLTPSGRGEYEISDVNDHYISQREMTYGILQGAWQDAGTF
ncbi:MAG: spore coat protein, partial [Candidatus Riflebacteria bacterium RBG_13_59_9]